MKTNFESAIEDIKKLLTLSPREKINKINAIIDYLFSEVPIAEDVSIYLSHFKIELISEHEHDINDPNPMYG